MTAKEAKSAIAETLKEVQDSKVKGHMFNPESTDLLIAEKLGIKFSPKELDTLYPDWDN